MDQVIFVPMKTLLQSHPWMHHLKWKIVILKSLKSVEFHSTLLTGVSLGLLGSHHFSNWFPWLSVHQSHCHVFKFLKHNHWCFQLLLLSSFTSYVYYVLVEDHPGDIEWFTLGLQRICCWNNGPWLQQLLRKWKCWFEWESKSSCIFCKLCFNGLWIWCCFWMSCTRSKRFGFCKKI